MVPKTKVSPLSRAGLTIIIGRIVTVLVLLGLWQLFSGRSEEHTSELQSPC